jgi:biotin carboxylase
MKRIAIIGASYLQLPLVQKVKEMGIEAHCFAWENGAVCKDIADFFYPISILEKEKILEVCKQINIDGITSIASDAAVPTICYIAEKLGLISNSYVDAWVVTNKFLMRERFAKNNVKSPFFVIADDNIFNNAFTFPLIVKPTDRSGSRGVSQVWNKKELKNAIKRAKIESFSKQAIVEEYITGSEVSVEAISWHGKHYILQITDKVTTGEPFFVELEHHQPSQLSDKVKNNIKQETLKALNALNVQYGASHSELKINEAGEVFVIEVGARMGGDFIGSDLVQLSTGYDFLKGITEIALGCFEKPIISQNNYSGVFFLSKEAENILSIINNSANYKEIIKSEIINSTLRNITNSSDRSGYFIYQSYKKFEL